MDERSMSEIDYSVASKEVIEALIEDASDPDIFEEIAKANTHRPEILTLLLEHRNTPEAVKKFVLETLGFAAAEETESVRTEKPKEVKAETLTMKIQKLSVSARIQLALKGGREIRGILARDPNKEVMLSVLENGKITIAEIELIVKNRSVVEEALRRIARNREWMKNYAVVQGIVTNPKTPPGIAVTYVTDLKTKDLAILEKNRNVAEAVRNASKRVLHARKPH